MESDELQIRRLVTTWMEATKSGDVETVLSLMSDDAVFLVPGRSVMRKPEFAAAAKAQSASGAPTIEGFSDIQEIQVAGPWAFMWTRLKLVVAAQSGAVAQTRAGHTLTIFKKVDGRWLLARDANLLAPEESAG